MSNWIKHLPNDNSKAIKKSKLYGVQQRRKPVAVYIRFIASYQVFFFFLIFCCLSFSNIFFIFVSVVSRWTDVRLSLIAQQLKLLNLSWHSLLPHMQICNSDLFILAVNWLLSQQLRWGDSSLLRCLNIIAFDCIT